MQLFLYRFGGSKPKTMMTLPQVAIGKLPQILSLTSIGQLPGCILTLCVTLQELIHKLPKIIACLWTAYRVKRLFPV